MAENEELVGPIAGIRALASLLSIRAGLQTTAAGKTFHGHRDIFRSLGYSRELWPLDYRWRFRRNAVAARIVEALPKATWRGGGELVEDDTVATQTPFESAWDELNTRLNIWSMFLRTDVLAGLGRYAILLLGTPGQLDEPLETLRPEELVYLSPFSEEDAQISKWETDVNNPRFGLPEFYTIRRIVQASGRSNTPEVLGRKVHYTRVLHIADTLLDDHVYGLPRLERVWNLLDDLDKVTGGGAEAFWKRADQGMQLDIDPTLDFDPSTEAALDKQLDEYTHNLRRVLKTRGLTVNTLGSDVADFKACADAIIDQLAAGSGIPQRVLLGSEAGHLASTQDRDNWAERVADRRAEFAAPQVVRPFVDRLIKLGTLPKPTKYDVRWPEIQSLNEAQKASVALQWSSLNKQAGQMVVTPDEIRDHVLGLPALTQKHVGHPVEETRLNSAKKLRLATTKFKIARRA